MDTEVIADDNLYSLPPAWRVLIANVHAVRDRRLKKLAWLKVSSIDDLEQKVGEIIVAVMVVNLLEMSLHMNYNAPLDLVWAALAAVMSAGALALLHYAAGHGDHNHKDKGGHDSGAGLLH